MANRTSKAHRSLRLPTLVSLVGLSGIFGISGTAAPTQAQEPYFADITTAAGVAFEHEFFGTGDKYMPENMGPGVAIFDTDGDGRLDIYLVQGAPIAPQAKAGAALNATNRLYRQTSQGGFEDVTARAGVGDAGVGMGAAFGDIDRDGDFDLYVTNFGRNTLYRNGGAGTFVDVTAKAGAQDERWSTGATFFDADGDGDLDLFVANYVNFSMANHKFCGNARQKLRAYCHPDVYDAVPDALFLNDGQGNFSDASERLGIKPSADAKGLGVISADFDGNGRQDIFVANDSAMNHLYLADRQGKFAESALFAGVGFNDAGAAEAGMGVEYGDVDGDGQAELFLTHLDQETNTLYKSLEPGLFADATQTSGLGPPSLPWVGFATVFMDVDNDSDLDVFVANGHIIDNIQLFDASRSHSQPAQLLLNDGQGRFREHSQAFAKLPPLVGRGAAAGDLDRDGDLDLVVSQNGGPALVLRNEIGHRNNSVTLRLIGRSSNPHGFGARVTGLVGQKQISRQVRGASGYLSQGPPELVLGIADAEQLQDVRIHWPSGQVDAVGALQSGKNYTVTEGSGTALAKR